LAPSHVTWVPDPTAKRRPRVAGGGDGLRLWSVAANILNKIARKAEKEWSSSLEVGRGDNSSLKKTACYEMSHRAKELDGVFGTTQATKYEYIRTDLRELGWEGVVWIHVAQDRDYGGLMWSQY
jgi:hypothetical protein